jgi:hypothetical protein
MLGQLTQRLRNETFQVVVLTGGLLVVAALMVRGLNGVPAAGHGVVSLPWWFFILAFALTEAVVMHIQVRREAQTVSISELPLVLGMFFAGPLVLLLGRLVGSVLTFVFYRRSSVL